MIPDDGRTPSVLCFSQLSAVLTNFQSVMLMILFYVSGFILGKKKKITFSLFTRVCYSGLKEIRF